jgi:hypothetical protein
MLFELDPQEAAIQEVHFATAIYTSKGVVDGLLSRLNWPTCGDRLLDPSCGDGAFLVQAIARMEIPCDEPGALDQVRGWEFFAPAARQARERVEEVLIAKGWTAGPAREEAGRVVVEGDFLLAGPKKGEFSIVVANPPYLRFARLPEYFKQVYRMHVDEVALGDLLHAFLDRCCAILPEKGVIAAVTSDRWIMNEGSARLRERLGKVVGIDHLARIDPSTSFYRPKLRRKGTLPRIHPIELVLRPADLARYPLTAAPITPEELGRAQEAGPTLGSIASVRIAPWLGPFGIFVMAMEDARTLGDIDSVPAVDTDDIDPHSEQLLEPKRVALRTRADKEPTGALGAHLRARADQNPAVKRGRNFWVPPETITLPLDKPALLIPRIARRIRAIPLPAGVLCINHNLSVVSAIDGLSLERLAEIITSPECQLWASRNAPRLENGYVSLTTGLLKRMPIPEGMLQKEGAC